MPKKDYKSQYIHPKWQKKRLQIMERDSFRCQLCHSEEKTLCVHHRYYIDDRNVWDYTHHCYITLCEQCHGIIHDKNWGNEDIASLLFVIDHHNSPVKIVPDTGKTKEEILSNGR